MTIYDEMQQVGKELLGEFKQGIIQLIRVTPGAGPVDDPGAPVTATTTLDAVAKGVPTKFIMQSLAVAGDLLVTSAVVDGITPSASDFIDIDGKRYKIVSILPTPPAGTRVVWKFIVRYGS